MSDLSEGEWSTRVRRKAVAAGWRVMLTRDSRGCPPGCTGENQ